MVVGDPNVAQPDPGNTMLNIEQAWQYSTGAGVTVAIIDTGVTPTHGSRGCSPAATSCRDYPTAG